MKAFIEKYRFVNKIYILLHFNPFVHSATFLYPFKISEKLTIFWCFQGVEKGCIGKKCVKYQISEVSSFFWKSLRLASFSKIFPSKLRPQSYHYSLPFLMKYVVDGRLIFHEVRMIYKAEKVFRPFPRLNFYTSK